MLLTIFRFTGDFLLISSRYILMKKIKQEKSVAGLSLKTQIIYLITYLLRYIDLKNFSSTAGYLQIYNSILKVSFILYQIRIIHLIYRHRKTYTKRFDTFPLSVLIGTATLISAVISDSLFYVQEFAYNMSLILESIAILPQLVMTQEAEECETMTGLYIILLGMYRMSYMLYFITKIVMGMKVDYLTVITSLVQTILYGDFFAVYYSYVFHKSKMVF
ncbi:KdelR [Nucleospora cyclopteri]